MGKWLSNRLETLGTLVHRREPWKELHKPPRRKGQVPHWDRHNQLLKTTGDLLAAKRLRERKQTAPTLREVKQVGSYCPSSGFNTLQSPEGFTLHPVSQSSEMGKWPLTGDIKSRSRLSKVQEAITWGRGKGQRLQAPFLYHLLSEPFTSCFSRILPFP